MAEQRAAEDARRKAEEVSKLVWSKFQTSKLRVSSTDITADVQLAYCIAAAIASLISSQHDVMHFTKHHSYLALKPKNNT